MNPSNQADRQKEIAEDIAILAKYFHSTKSRKARQAINNLIEILIVENHRLQYQEASL